MKKKETPKFNREEQKDIFIGDALTHELSVEGIIKWMDFLLETMPKDLKNEPVLPEAMDIAREIKKEYTGKNLTENELLLLYFKTTKLPMPVYVKEKLGII